MERPFTYLLLLDFDGEKHGYSNREPELVDGQMFASGLIDISLPAREAPLFGFSGGADMGFSIALEQTDAIALQQKGVRLQRSVAECWAWLPDQTLDQAVQIFKGEIRSPAFDLNTGIFSARAGAPAFVSDAPFPPAQIGDEGRFASQVGELPDDSLRLAVPIIYGTVTGSPLIPLELNPGVGTAVFLVAGHKLTSSTIQPALDGVAVGGALTVVDGIDDLGNPFAYVNVPFANYDPNLYAESVEGKPAPDGNAIERLGDVLIDIWLSFGHGKFFDLDRERVYASRPLLNRYRVGALFNTRTEGQTIIDLLNTRFAQQYPVVFGPANGRFGWDAVFIPPNTADPVLTLIYGQTIHDRQGLSQTDAAQVRNRFEIEYAQDSYQGSTVSSRRLDDSNDGVCRGSVSRWGESPVHSWQAGDVPDDGTAYLLAEDEARRYAKVRWRVTYGLANPAVLQLPLFGVVLVTDDALSWSRKKFLIEGLVPRPDGRVDLRLIEL